MFQSILKFIGSNTAFGILMMLIQSTAGTWRVSASNQ